MERKAVSRIMLILLLTTMLGSNFQQHPLISEVMSVEPSVPLFVSESKFVYESGSAFEWLDPHVSYYQYDYWILQQTVETLLWFNGSGSTHVVPWLAESYTKINETQYEFKLKQNIKFQDVTPFNATAVWFSLNRLLMMDGTSGDPLMPVHGSQTAWIIEQMLDTSLFAYFTGYQPYDSVWVQKVLNQNFVEIVDTYTVRLNIKTPSLQFPYLLSGPWASIVSPTSVIAKDYAYHNWGTWDGNYTKYFERMAGRGDTYFNVPEQGWKIGTGPYYIQSVDRNTYRIVLMANEAYWGGPTNIEHPIDTPKIKSLEYLYQPSLATRLENLRAGKVTGIDVSPLDIYAVADRDKWLNEGILQSVIQNVTIYGPFEQLRTVWFNFCTNVTDPVTGSLKKFQPMADIRFRTAIASAANITDLNINVNNRLGVVAQNLIPPDTAPEGAYNPNNKPAYSYNLTRVEELLVDAWLHPLASATHEINYYNGTRIPAGVVDNSFSETNQQTIEMYVPTGATNYERVLLTIAENLNRISTRTYNKSTGVQDPNGEQLGLTFVVVPVPGGQQYTLASRHQIYMYWGGWFADYNHLINWLGPMYLSTGTYFSWNQWNITSLDNLYWQAVEAVRSGDVASLLDINNQMNKIVNDMTLYMWLWHPTTFFVRSSYLKGWYYNTALQGEYFAPMYYPPEDTTAPTIGIPSRIPDGDVLPEQEVKVSVNVTDAVSGVKNVTLSYTINDGATWTSLPMNYNTSTNLYEASISPQPVGTWVKYKIVAYDNAENPATLDGTQSYCVYQVVPEFLSATILLLFMVFTLVAVILMKKSNRSQ